MKSMMNIYNTRYDIFINNIYKDGNRPYYFETSSAAIILNMNTVIYTKKINEYNLLNIYESQSDEPFNTTY